MQEDKTFSFRRSKQVESLERQTEIRVLAFIIDLILLNHVVIPAMAILVLWDMDWQINMTYDSILFYVIVVTSYILYFTFFESSPYRASPGKLFFRLKVHSDQGTRISPLKAFARTLSKIPSFVSIIGILLIDLTKEKQALHDLMCHTIVRRVNPLNTSRIQYDSLSFKRPICPKPQKVLCKPVLSILS